MKGMFINLLLFLVIDLVASVRDGCKTIFINEFHYDNFLRLSDVTDFVEIAGPAGASLEGWQLMLYDGHEGQVCGNGVCENQEDEQGIYCLVDCQGFPMWTFGADAVFPDDGSGWGTVSMTFGQLIDGHVENDLFAGFNDGIILVNDAGVVEQVIIYEPNTITVDEFSSNSAPLNTITDFGPILTVIPDLYLFSSPLLSIQLQGSGFCYDDFTWVGPGNKAGISAPEYAASRDQINNNQVFYAFPSVSPSNNPTRTPSHFPSKSPSLSPSFGPSTSPSKSPSSSRPTANPSVSPTLSPTHDPTKNPSHSPSVSPTKSPSVSPSKSPSWSAPTKNPSVSPSNSPTVTPSPAPSKSPSVSPSFGPSSSPTSSSPSVTPSFNPTGPPSPVPSAAPTVPPTTDEPSASPSLGPTQTPSRTPSHGPTLSPITSQPTKNPSGSPSQTPTRTPSATPTVSPTTDMPTNNPSQSPSRTPSRTPSKTPTLSPSTSDPTPLPTNLPSRTPSTSHPTTKSPSAGPTVSPTTDSPSANPSHSPSVAPSHSPSVVPTLSPSSSLPTKNPSVSPTTNPSNGPTRSPSRTPSVTPSDAPSHSPSVVPTTSPSTSNPSPNPSFSPTVDPTVMPTSNPSVSPTFGPSVSPSWDPTVSPTKNPSRSPTHDPTVSPSNNPTVAPSFAPSVMPTPLPTSPPSKSPTFGPTQGPSKSPTFGPSTTPTVGPSFSPSVIPTSSPSDNPTVCPSHAPSKTPSAYPTGVPSENPSLSPTIEACALAHHRKVGSSLIVMTDASGWNDDDDELTLVLELPAKYTTTQMIFEGASDDTLKYEKDVSSTFWTHSFDAETCMNTFTFVGSWSSVSPTASVTEDSGSYYFTGAVEVTSTETFFHDIYTTEQYTRNVVESFVWILGIQSTVELTFDVASVFVHDASTFHVFDRLAVLEHDGTSSSVTIEYTTEVNYPWVIDPAQHSFLDESPYGIPYVDEGTLTEQNRGTGCGVADQYCLQDWSVTFDVTAVCDILGNWTVQHYAVYEGETQEFDFTAVVSLDSVCATTFTNIETDATLTSFDSSAFANAATEFFVGSTSYFRVVVDDALQQITSISLDSVEVTQTILHNGADSVSTVAGSDLQLTSIDDTTPLSLDFSIYLDPDRIKGDELATVAATVAIDYIDRRRHLAIDDQERRILIVEEIPRRSLIYVNSENQVKLEHVIVVSDRKYCIKNEATGETSEINEIHQQRCESDENRFLTRQCTPEGWQVIVDQCPTLTQTENLTSSLNKETETSGKTWEVIFFALLAATIVGLALYAACKCYRPSIVSTSGTLNPEKPIMLNITPQETKC